MNLSVSKMLPCRQHAAQQERCIDRRDFALPLPLACVGIDEVIIKTVNMRQSLPEKTQRGAHSRQNLIFLPISARVADAQCGQSKSGGSDARDLSLIVAIQQGAIFHLPRRLSGFTPEIVERG